MQTYKKMSIENTKLNTKLNIETFDNIKATIKNEDKTTVSVDHNFLVPDYTPPTNAIIAWNSYMEVGAIFGDQILTEFVKNDAGIPLSMSIFRNDIEVYIDDNLIGIQIDDMPEQFGFDNPNNPNFKYDSSYIDFTEVEPGIVKYSSSVRYLSGLPKQNSSNGLDGRKPSRRQTNAPQAGSLDFRSEDIFVSGVYPYYYGLSNAPMTKEEIQELIDSNDSSLNFVVADSMGDVTIRYDSNEQYLWFAHASIYDQKNSWLNSDTTNGEITSGGFIEKTGQFQLSNTFWVNIDFTIYQSNAVSTTYELTYLV